MIMYSSVTPGYDDLDSEGGSSKGSNREINADDPRNREAVRNELFGKL